MWGGSIPSNLAFTRSPFIQTINTQLPPNFKYPWHPLLTSCSSPGQYHKCTSTQFLLHHTLLHSMWEVSSFNPFSLSSHISAVLWMLPRCIDLKAVNFQLGLKGQTVHQGGLRDAHLWIWRKNYFEKYEKCIKEGLRDPHGWIKRDFFAWSLNERERTLVYMQTLR